MKFSIRDMLLVTVIVAVVGCKGRLESYVVTCAFDARMWGVEF